MCRVVGNASRGGAFGRTRGQLHSGSFLHGGWLDFPHWAVANSGSLTHNTSTQAGSRVWSLPCLDGEGGEHEGHDDGACGFEHMIQTGGVPCGLYVPWGLSVLWGLNMRCGLNVPVV